MNFPSNHRTTMTEISGNDLDLSAAQQIAGFQQSESGNLISTQGIGTYSSGALSGLESIGGGFVDGGAQYSSSSYDAYDQCGSESAGMAGIADRRSFESFSYDGAGGIGGGGSAFGGSEFIGIAGAEEAVGSSAGAFYSHSSAMETGGAMGGADFAGASLPLNAYKIQVDQNPTIVRRALSGAAAVQRQNIIVRFLRPPAPPAPGPLIIKEFRPPQPRPAPPLIIRQRPPRPRSPPPLILRECPPRMPFVVRTQTVVKRLPALPPPPRQVIIERFPALPAKPRDVIIERWLQYGPLPKRKIIYQRAAAARTYRTAKNLIIQYTAPRPTVQRVFRRLGVVSMSPSAYLSQYGATLLDSNSIVSAARNAGVVENIAPPALVYAVGGTAGLVDGAMYSSSSHEVLGAGGSGYDSGIVAGMGDLSYAGYQDAGATGIYGTSSDQIYSSSSGGGSFGATTRLSPISEFASGASEYDAGGTGLVAASRYEYSSNAEGAGVEAGSGVAESFETNTVATTEP